MIAVTIEDYARQTVAFAPDDASQFWIDPAPVAVLRCLGNPALEKIEIEVLLSPRKPARHDL